MIMVSWQISRPLTITEAWVVCLGITVAGGITVTNELRFLLREAVTPELSLSEIEPQQKPR